MKRTLITTALEDTWPSIEKPVIFLGEWCKLYSRKEKWKKFDSITVPYHWDNRKKMYDDYLYIRQVYESVLEALHNKLNEIHSTKYSIRYWRLIVGPWLGYFIQILFDRYEMIRITFENYEIDSVNIDSKFDSSLIPKDMSEFVGFFTEDNWNFKLFSLIVQSRKNLKSHEINLSENKIYKFNSKNASLKGLFKKNLENFIGLLSNFFRKQTDGFIFNSYLSVFEFVKLHFHLSQFPMFHKFKFFRRESPLMEKREWNVKLDTKSEFEDLLLKLIPLQIPTVYLEQYTKAKNFVLGHNFPENPKFIFTSNSHNSDDMFKIWAADKVENQVPLFIGQHGGHFGMGLYSLLEEHDITISDKYLSWGWELENESKVVPTFALNVSGKSNFKYNKAGNLLLVTTTVPRYSYWMYSAFTSSQWLSYFNDQVKFCKNLEEQIFRNSLIRLYSHDYGWDQENRWKAEFPEVNLDIGHRKIDDLIKQSRIYISTYNATTYLESFSRNMPTIMFWNPFHWELRKTAVPYFEKLKEIGIFHESPESAAKKVNEIWDDIDSWWLSNSIQEIKDEFCFNYARKIQNPNEHLCKIFNNQ